LPAPINWADLVARALRHGDPAGVIPALNEASAPFALHHTRDPFACPARKRTQRIAVEIDDAGRKLELPAEFAQLVGTIEDFEVLPACDHRRLLMSSCPSMRDADSTAYALGDCPLRPIPPQWAAVLQAAQIGA
jgi:hypothetical protein